MQTFSCVIATENPALAPFTGRKFSSGINPVSFKELTQFSKNTAKSLSMLYVILTGQQPDEEMTAISIGAKSGAFSRFYGPEFCRNEENELGIAFGKTFLPIKLKKGVFDGTLPAEDMEIKFTFQVAELNGFDELVFKVSILIGATDTLITFLLPIRFEDYKAKKPEAEALQIQFERKPAEVAALLNTPYDGSGGFDGPTYKLGQLMAGEIYKVVGYVPRNTSNGLTYLLNIEGETDEEGPTQAILDVAGFDDSKPASEYLTSAQVWSNSSLKGFLGTNPAITPETPAELVIRSKKKTASGNITVDCSLIFDSPDVVAVTEEDLDFNF